jgi:hypothetical protein
MCLHQEDPRSQKRDPTACRGRLGHPSQLSVRFQRDLKGVLSSDNTMYLHPSLPFAIRSCGGFILLCI